MLVAREKASLLVAIEKATSKVVNAVACDPSANVPIVAYFQAQLQVGTVRVSTVAGLCEYSYRTWLESALSL